MVRYYPIIWQPAVQNHLKQMFTFQCELLASDFQNINVRIVTFSKCFISKLLVCLAGIAFTDYGCFSLMAYLCVDLFWFKNHVFP